MRGMLAALVLMLAGVAAADGPWEMVQTEEHKGSGVRFTRPDGTPIYVNPHAVAFVRAPLPGEIGNATIVFSSGAKQAVQETVQQVIDGVHEDMPERH